MKQERDGKFHTSHLEKVELKKRLKEKDNLIEFLKQHVVKRSRGQEDLFSSNISSSTHLPTSGVWKGIVDQLVIEKDAMKSNYEREIKRLHKKYQLGIGSSSDMIP